MGGETTGGGGGGNGGRKKKPAPAPKPAPTPIVTNPTRERGRGAEPARTTAPSKPASKPAPSPRDTMMSIVTGGDKGKEAISRKTSPRDEAEISRFVDTLAAESAAETAKEKNVANLAKAKRAEVGVKYETSGPRVGNIGDYRVGGISPNEVNATVGATGAPPNATPEEVRAYRGKAMGNIAGRDDVTRDNLGDLASRVNTGDAGFGSIPSVATSLLSMAGRANASNMLDKLVNDTPTIEDGKVKYGVDVVKGDNDRIMGVVSDGAFGGRVYSGRSEYNPMNTGGLMGGGSNTTPAPPTSAPSAPAPEDSTSGTVSTAVGASSKKKRKNLMGTDAARELRAKGLLSRTQSDRILMGG